MPVKEKSQIFIFKLHIHCRIDCISRMNRLANICGITGILLFLFSGCKCMYDDFKESIEEIFNTDILAIEMQCNGKSKYDIDTSKPINIKQFKRWILSAKEIPWNDFSSYVEPLSVLIINTSLKKHQFLVGFGPDYTIIVWKDKYFKIIGSDKACR